MAYIIYIVYNLIYEAVSLFLILYAETYLNGFLIPESLIWNKDGTKKQHPVGAEVEDLILLCIEGALLLILLYFINRWFLKTFTNATSPNIILKWTVGVLSIITVVFICSLHFGFYFPLP